MIYFLVGYVYSLNHYFVSKQIPADIHFHIFTREDNVVIDMDMDAVHLIMCKPGRLFRFSLRHRRKIGGHSAAFQLHLVNCEMCNLLFLKVLG